MSYVIYNAKTYRIIDTVATERTANGRAKKLAVKNADETYAVMTSAAFAEIEPMVERTNLMSGKTYMERLNTPACCSPACELYWNM